MTAPALPDPGDTEVFPRAPRPSAVALAEPMRSRWSPSVLDPTFELTDDQVTSLLRAAQWAPSWGNSQPWHYLVARRGTPTHDALVSTLSRGNRSWVPTAALVLVGVVAVAEVDGKEPSPVAEYDAGQAAAHVTLQAWGMGLVAHQFSGFDHEEFARLMKVPDEYRVMPAIAVGALGDPSTVEESLAAKHFRPRTRRPLAQTAFEDAWGQPFTGLDA